MYKIILYMLIDTQYNSQSKKLIVSYVDENGKIKMEYFDWQRPMKYERCEENDPQRDPTYKSWEGYPVKQVEASFPDRYAIYEFLDALPQKEQDRIFKFNLPDIYFVDIETARGEDGFAPPSDERDNEGNITRQAATEPILSISVVYDNKIILLGLKDLSTEAQKRIHKNTNKYFEKDNVVYDFKYEKFECEFDMLYSFFKNMVPQMPVITGWNFVNYDWAYLVNRARLLTKNVNGHVMRIDPNQASPTSRLEKVWNPIPGSPTIELPVHRMIFDYMQLYDISDTSIKVKESSSLDFVSSKLVGVEKIKYDGQLDQLYHDDFEKFMYYNAVDSVLVQKIHDARNYISIIYGISTLARIKISDVVNQANSSLASLAITEGVLRNRFREQDKVVLFKDNSVRKDPQGISGGWVKDPVVGMNRWCVTYDFASLYPSVQNQFFIAPENFIGVQRKDDKTVCDNGAVIDFENQVVCSNRCVFNKRVSPTIKMLRDVFADRKVNKKIMLTKKDELNAIKEQIKELEAML